MRNATERAVAAAALGVALVVNLAFLALPRGSYDAIVVHHSASLKGDFRDIRKYHLTRADILLASQHLTNPFPKEAESMGQSIDTDFAAIWAEHVKHEFETANTEDTLATMVDDAYVNHIPTLTGGVGKEALREFYSRRFIPQMPPDTEMIPVSQTIGKDRLVDEMIFKFTHTIEMDWMLPGIQPTGKRVEIPLVAIVHFRGDKLAHEHIYWDQASVLVQLGLIEPGDLPVSGAESAAKVLDTSLPSNALIERADRRKQEQ